MSVRSLFVVALLAIVPAAAAQTSSTPPASSQPSPETATPPVAASAPTPAPTPAVIAGFQDGFFIQSPNGDNRLLFGLVAQTDGRFSLDDPTPIVNTFALRKMRPTLSGRVARYFDFKVMPDFGNGGVVVQDAYLDVRFARAFRLRSGKDKTPIGYELLQGDAFLLFPERSLASSLVPNRDVGIQGQGDIGVKLFYSAGVFNGIPDGTSSTTDVDTNNAKDVAGRVVLQPFRRSTGAPTAFSGFGVQVGGSTGKQLGPLPTFRTSVGQAYFAYAAGAVADGNRNRVSPAAFYYYKALGVFGEYMWSTQRVTRLADTRDISNEAWEVTASYVITGEAASERGVRPRNPFDPPGGKWGALQLLARYTELHVDPDAFTSGLAAAGASPVAKSFTVGANWYPAAYIKYYGTFERTTFAPGALTTRPAENVILFRLQLGF
jgi:phosphate-selective porin OprO and OprP